MNAREESLKTARAIVSRLGGSPVAHPSLVAEIVNTALRERGGDQAAANLLLARQLMQLSPTPGGVQ